MINTNYSINNSIVSYNSNNNCNQSNSNRSISRANINNPNADPNSARTRAYSRYRQQSVQFYEEFDSKFMKLKRAANKLKGDSNENIFKDSSATDQDIFDTIKDFVDDYNKSINFLKSNRETSDQIADLLRSYKKMDIDSDKLSSIGLNFNEGDGTISLDQTTLAKAIEKDKDNVEEIITDTYNGIATQTYNKTSVAIRNSETLFPKFKYNLNLRA